MGEKVYMVFSSPKGCNDVRLYVDKAASLNTLLSEVYNKTATRHEPEAFHFSINSQSITDYNTPLMLNTNDRVVASWSKVGGSF